MEDAVEIWTLRCGQQLLIDEQNIIRKDLHCKEMIRMILRKYGDGNVWNDMDIEETTEELSMKLKTVMMMNFRMLKMK
jgi:hypothetical protein